MGMRLVQVVVLVVGAARVLDGALSEGGFVAFLLLSAVFLRPIEKITAVIELYPRGVAGFRRYHELLDTAPEVVDRPGAREAGRLRGDVRIEGVSFGYDPERPVLRDVSVAIPAGSTVDATPAEVAEAAERARLGELVASLPDGLDTVVGERGVALSGGQKQRLAIARAFLRNPPILILDEATSARDTETERRIQAALDELSRDRTTLVIAHRLNTIRRADLIVVMEGGRVVEAGTDADLRARSGAYARLDAA